jgi:predicted ATPase/class 3 adenylate cyclase
MPSQLVHFLFTDIEGSTRLWEQHTEAMREALACHDRFTRQALQAHRGSLVKSTGDGVHAVFGDALDGLRAMLQLQRALADPAATAGVPLALRCGLHAGASQARDNDFYGPEVNRAARIMSVAHGGQMLLSQAMADALAQRLPEGVALRELGAVRLRNLSRPERLWQVLAPPLRTDFPALRALEATPNNLTQPLNRFIGRSRVLPAVRALLQQHRLVTLYGTGGIGKSRLAMQLGTELIDDYPDGVWFVELAPLADGARVAQAVAAVLGVREAPGQPLAEALQRFVAERRLLLMLDNCEHVLPATAELAKRLLQAGGGLRLLATSREVLRVAGEASFPVPALSVPATPHGITPSPERLLQHEAVLLFADRAAAASSGFALTADNAAAVAEICQRLDGIPLAIELAAARVRALSVQAIASRLRDSLHLLATHDTTVAPRQRTLQRLIDWSHDLLGEPERMLYRRLAVFVRGWTLSAAEAVCGDATLSADEVLDALTLLVEKSLVVMALDDGEEGARYRLLESVRQHAAAELAAAEGAAEALRQRHAGCFLALAEQARPQLAGSRQAEGLARLDAERDNLLAALAWCARGDVADPVAARSAVEHGLRLSFALRPYWINRGLLSVGLGATLAVLGRPAARPRDARRARGLLDAGQLCGFMGRYAEARTHLAESAAIAQEVGDLPCVTAAQQALGMAAMGLDDRAAARGHYEAAVAAARALDNPRQLTTAVNALAQLERVEGQLATAGALFQQALALARGLGDAEYTAVAMLNQAMVQVAQGEADAARALLLSVIAIADRNGSRPAALGALDVCAGLAVARGDWGAAALYYGLSEAQNALAGSHRDAADEGFLSPLIDRARQALGSTAFAAAVQQGRQAPMAAVWDRLPQWLAPPATPPAGAADQRSTM